MHGGTSAVGALDNPLYLGNNCKTWIQPHIIFYAKKMTAAQITELSAGILKKSRLEAEQTLFSNLYLFLGETLQIYDNRG